MIDHDASTARCTRVRIIFLIWILILTAALSAGPLAASQDLVAEIYAQGISLYSAGDHSGAAEYLEQVVTMAPEHDQARYYLVFSLSMSGKTRKALEQAKLLAARFPQNVQYQLLVQQLNRQNVSYSQTPAPTESPQPDTGYSSITTLQEPAVARPVTVRKASPPRPPDKIEQAAALIDEEQYASATAALKKILGAEPRNAEAWHFLGVASFNQAEFALAAENFEKALANGHKNFETRFLAGSSYLNMQIWDKAENHFKEALELKSDLFCKMNLAEIFCRRHRFKEAEKMFQEILKSNPEVIDASVGLAQIKLEQGYSKAAADSINEILSSHPDNSRARFVKARILLENKLYAEAAEEARLAAVSNPGNLEYRACYALALIRNFQVPQGIEEARAILQQNQSNTAARQALAEGLIVGGNLKDAEAELQLAEKSEKHPLTSFLLASIAISGGNQTLARQHYEEYKRRAGNQPTALLEYARFLETLGSSTEAAAAYHEVIRLHDDTPYAEEAQAGIERLAHADSQPGTSRIGSIPIPGLNNP